MCHLCLCLLQSNHQSPLRYHHHLLRLHLLVLSDHQSLKLSPLLTKGYHHHHHYYYTLHHYLFLSSNRQSPHPFQLDHQNTLRLYLLLSRMNCNHLFRPCLFLPSNHQSLCLLLPPNHQNTLRLYLLLSRMNCNHLFRPCLFLPPNHQSLCLLLPPNHQNTLRFDVLHLLRIRMNYYNHNHLVRPRLLPSND